MSKILSGEYTAIAITNSVSLQMVHGVRSNDEIEIAEDISYLVDPLDIYVSDSVGIAEDINPVHSLLSISTNDSVSAEDTIFWIAKDAIVLTVNDTVTISDSGSYQDGFYDLTVNTSVTIAESVSVVNVGMISDSVSVDTAVTVFIPILTSSEYTSVSIEDTYTRVLAQLTVYDSIYVRSVFNESIASTTLDSIPHTIVSTQTIFSSAARTATVGYYISNSFKVSSAIMLRFHFDVTVEAGTSSLGSIIQVSPDNVTWYDALTIPAITAIGNYTGTLANPGVYVRVKSIITGTSFTYSCLMTKHMINIPSPRMVYA